MAASLHCLSASLSALFDGPGGPEDGLPQDSLPALRALTLCISQFESATGLPPRDLCALTALTQLQVEGPAIKAKTPMEWRESVPALCWDDAPDSEGLEEEGLEDDREWVAPLAVEPHFYLLHLRELSLLSCFLEQIPEFIAGAAAGAGLLGLPPHEGEFSRAAPAGPCERMHVHPPACIQIHAFARWPPFLVQTCPSCTPCA